MARPAVDILGKKFGKLTVIKRVNNLSKDGAKWKCLCDCGRTVTVRGTQLRRGMIKNCGCEPGRFINLVGRRFGKLTVIKRVENIKRNATRFLCRCDCGNDVIRLSRSLLGGVAVSCGCWKSLPPEEGACRALFRQMQWSAKYREITWKLSDEFFRWITKQPCYYCGAEPYQIYQPKRKTGGYLFNGIDRVDNKIGYVQSNVVPCCGMCNVAKHANTVDKFKEWIKSAYNHWASK